jgi:hypothetical protein
MQPCETSLTLLRDRLKDHQAKGTLGVIAARSNVAEWIIRDWCDNSLHVPNRMEVQKLQDALDNKKRHAPSDAAAPVNGGHPSTNVDAVDREID